MKNNMSNLNYFIIEYICIAYNEGRYEDLKRMGIPLEIAAQLTQLNMTQIGAISKFRSPIFQITANTDNFNHLMTHFNREAKQEVKVYDLIRYGATYPLIADLTGTTRVEFNALCVNLGVDSRCNSGKPRNLTDAEIKQQSDLLATMDGRIDPLDKLWTMVTKTGMPAGPVWRWLQTGSE